MDQVKLVSIIYSLLRKHTRSIYIVKVIHLKNFGTLKLTGYFSWHSFIVHPRFTWYVEWPSVLVNWLYPKAKSNFCLYDKQVV